MKFTKEDFALVKKAVELEFYTPGMVHARWEAAKASAKKDPVIWFAAAFAQPVADMFGGWDWIYKKYTDDHFFTALVKALKEDGRFAEVFA